MMPAPQQFAPPRKRTGGRFAAVLGLLALGGLFLPGRDLTTHKVFLEWRPSAELAAILFLFTMAVLAKPRLFAGRTCALVLPNFIVVAALLNLPDVETPLLLESDLNLYWDLQHLPSLFGLASESAGLWRALVVAGVFLAGFALLIGAT